MAFSVGDSDCMQVNIFIGLYTNETLYLEYSANFHVVQN